MRRVPLIACAVLAVVLVGAAALVRQVSTPAPARSPLEDRWGVKVEGIRLSAGGYMLDFRYRVLDAHKARAVVDRQWKPYLVDRESGARLMVPAPGKIGPLRQTMRNGGPQEGKTYFVLFANPGQMVRRGQRVSVVIGEFEAQDLIVG